MSDLSPEERVMALSYTDFPRHEDEDVRDAWIIEHITGKTRYYEPVSLAWAPERLFDNDDFLQGVALSHHQGEICKLPEATLVKLAPYWARYRGTLDPAFQSCPVALRVMLKTISESELHPYGTSAQKQLLQEISTCMFRNHVKVTLPCRVYARFLIALRYSLAYPGAELAFNVSAEDHDAKMRELMQSSFFEKEINSSYKNVTLLTSPTTDELYELLRSTYSNNQITVPYRAFNPLVKEDALIRLFTIAATTGRKNTQFGLLATHLLRSLSHRYNGFVTESSLRALSGLTESALKEAVRSILAEPSAIYLLHLFCPSDDNAIRLTLSAVEIPAKTFAELVDRAASEPDVKAYQIGVPHVDPEWLLNNKKLFKQKQEAFKILLRARPTVRYVPED